MTTTKRVAFDLDNEIALAVDYLLKEIDKGEFYGKPYFTATDVERRVRSAAAEIMSGKERGSLGLDGGWYSSVRISTGGHGNLLSAVRHVLLRLPGLDRYNPSGRYCLSSLRFRRANAGLSEAEERTAKARAAEKARGPIVHFAEKTTEPSMCMKGRTRKPFWGSRPRAIVRKTDDRSKVTCKRCLSLLKASKTEEKTEPTTTKPWPKNPVTGETIDNTGAFNRAVFDILNK